MNEREGGADGKMVRSPMFAHTPSMDRTGIFDDDVVQMKMLPKSLAHNVVLLLRHYIILFTLA